MPLKRGYAKAHDVHRLIKVLSPSPNFAVDVVVKIHFDAFLTTFAQEQDVA